MTPTATALVVAAACLHATWNALAKRSGDQLLFLWCAMAAASVLLTPVAIWAAVSTPVPASAIPFVLATIALHALYFYSLGRSYRSGDLSLVYPISRGLGVALVPLIAIAAFDERPSAVGALGVALVVAGIVLLHRFGPARDADAPSSAGATRWAILTGLTIASYSVVDKAGVARIHPAAYIAMMAVGAALVLMPAALRDGVGVRREWRTNWQTILLAATLTYAAYLLVLFAFRLSKVAYVVAARELSIVLSTFIGSLWLKEGRLVPRLLGAAVILAGVVAIALAH